MRRRQSDGDGFRPPLRFGRKEAVAASGGALVVVALMVLGSVAATGITVIDTGEIGVIVNNLTGKIRVQIQPGRIIHLPFGIVEVYTLDSKLQTLAMTGHVGSARTRGDGNVVVTEGMRIKSRDGSDVFMDATITYTIDPMRGERVAREIGARQTTMDPDILISFARSIARDEIGKLSIDEVIDAAKRSGAVAHIQEQLAGKMEPFGIVVNTVDVQNPSFHPKFEELVRERKSIDQQMLNQAVAQINAQSEQERSVAEAGRVRATRLREVEGQQVRRLTETQKEAEALKERAAGESYRMEIEGQRDRDVALQEAQAMRSELLKKAEGLRALAEAYQRGGLGLVREALAAKYVGARISGRPYSLAVEVDRMMIEEVGTAPAEKAAAAGAAR